MTNRNTRQKFITPDPFPPLATTPGVPSDARLAAVERRMRIVAGLGMIGFFVACTAARLRAPGSLERALSLLGLGPPRAGEALAPILRDVVEIVGKEFGL